VLAVVATVTRSPAQSGEGKAMDSDKTGLNATHELRVPWSYPWDDPDSAAWRLTWDPVAAAAAPSTVIGGGHNGHPEPGQPGEGEPKMCRSDDNTRDAALAWAEQLEEALAPGSVKDYEVLDDALELIADTRRVLRVVLSTGGPHTELVLGDGAPRIEVWWGGDHFKCVADLDSDFVDDFVATWWRPALEAALNR
jgi:hypothetical protein